MRSEKRDVFVSDDGKVFETAEQCQSHERVLAAQKRRIEGLKVYTVTHGFDSTEGRGYYRTTYIITDATYAAVLQFCFDRFGSPLQQWYGDGHYEAWHIHQRDFSANEALTKAKEPHSGVGLGTGKVDVVFLSNDDIDHDGLPKRTPFWPRQKPRSNK